ncbi:hypothetical protein PT148_09095, partial [Erysipelothrix rhusiopathiae]|nr:hypothetical protein [Erysipelothrix rhusiopathiae]
QLIFAENLAKRAFSVESAMSGFMESPSHRANILDDFKSGACASYVPRASINKTQTQSNLDSLTDR